MLIPLESTCHNKSQFGYIYILKADNLKDVYKIGSSSNPNRRFYSSRRSGITSVSVVSLYLVSRPRIVEMFLHDLFRKNQSCSYGDFMNRPNLSREWYEFSADTLESVMNIISMMSFKEEEYDVDVGI